MQQLLWQMTMTVTQCLDLSLRGHGPHASYELTGQYLKRQMNFNKEAAASKLPLRHTVPGSRPLRGLRLSLAPAPPMMCNSCLPNLLVPSLRYEVVLQGLPLFPILRDPLPDPSWCAIS